MKKAAIILRKPPYGDINASEAIRHAMGSISEEIETFIILIDGGVLLAKKGQSETGTGFTNLETALMDSIDMGAQVYADMSSVKEHDIDPSEIVQGVRLANGHEVADIIQQAKAALIF